MNHGTSDDCECGGEHPVAEQQAAVVFTPQPLDVKKTSRGVWNWLAQVPGMGAIHVVQVYQYLISPMLGKTCRFYPSCSQYFIQCVRKHGLIKALGKGTWRICRCHPWNPGGFDPP
jgi:uncharacterized protein